MKYSCLLLAFLPLLWSCAKDDSSDPNTILNPQGSLSIEILSPGIDTMIQSGDSAAIIVLLKDKLSLHEFTLSVTDSAETEYFYEEGHSHNPEVLLNYVWYNNAPSGTRLILRIAASNHQGEVLKQSRTFYSN